MCGCGNCGSKKLCPVSFGLALGLTVALGYLLWVVWMIYFATPAAIAAAHMPVPTLEVGTVHAFWALLKGFVFGFFVALFYDFISCCCKSRFCCKKSECKCGASCTCGASGSKPDVAGK